MFEMAKFVEVKRLLDQVEAVETGLTPNEREMFRSLLAKYAEPGQTDFDDQVCLEVILRNVEIRKGYNIDPVRDPGRVIDLPHVPGRESNGGET